MPCEILAVGQKMPTWCVQACQEYTKRLQHLYPTTVIEIPTSERSATRTVQQCKAEEGRKIGQKIRSSDYVVALAVSGQSWSTEKLAEKVASWKDLHKKTVLVIGGPDGLDQAVLDRAQIQWSLSPLTLPHPIARVVALEQLYRAMTLLTNHPYHRG